MSDLAPHSDIQELFQRDPLGMTKDDITIIITKMRQSRGQFALGNQRAGSTKPLSAKAKAAVDAAGKLDLGDLGL